MKDTLKVGATAQFAFRVPAEKTVPHLYPEAPEFREMPTVFATGFMVGLMEWTCLKVLEPHLEEGEGSLGVHIDVSHIAATVPGQTVTVDAECTKFDGRRGRHVRMIIQWTRFVARVNEKAKAARVAQIGEFVKS
jgi:fluoroacetyl-CoA thioesterase